MKAVRGRLQFIVRRHVRVDVGDQRAKGGGRRGRAIRESQQDLRILAGRRKRQVHLPLTLLARRITETPAARITNDADDAISSRASIVGQLKAVADRIPVRPESSLQARADDDRPLGSTRLQKMSRLEARSGQQRNPHQREVSGADVAG